MKAIHTNLATFEYIDRRLSLLLMLSTSVIILCISVYMIRQFFAGAEKIQENRTKIYQREQQIASKTRNASEEERVLTKEQIKSIEHRIAEFNRLIAIDIFPWNRILEELERSLPEGISLVSFAPADDFRTITLKGLAESESRISFFLKRLEESELFDTNTLLAFQVKPKNDSITGKKEETGIPFTIESRLSAAGVFSDPYYRGIGKSLIR